MPMTDPPIGLPRGWWLASDGKWYPPQNQAPRVAPIGRSPSPASQRSSMGTAQGKSPMYLKPKPMSATLKAVIACVVAVIVVMTSAFAIALSNADQKTSADTKAQAEFQAQVCRDVLNGDTSDIEYTSMHIARPAMTSDQLLSYVVKWNDAAGKCPPP
jgi:hypothetical protein